MRNLGVLRSGALGLLFLGTFLRPSVSYAFHWQSLLAISSLGVINRQEDDEYTKKIQVDPNALVLVQKPGGICGGAFLSDTLAITASHCVVEMDPTGGVSVEGIQSIDVFFAKELEEKLVEFLAAIAEGKVEEFKAKVEEEYKRKTADPEFRKKEGENDEEYTRRIGSPSLSKDFAILKFPEGTGELLEIKKYPALAKHRPEAGDNAFLVGHGVGNILFNADAADLAAHDYNDEVLDKGAGVKGWGNLVLAETISDFHWSVKDYVPVEKPSTTRSGGAMVGPGDSGSLLLDKNGDGIGIAVALLSPRDETTKKNSFGLGNWLKFEYELVERRGWDVRGGFASVHSEMFQEALKRAEAEPTPAAAKASFPKHYLRTGKYAPKGKAEAKHFQAHGQYVYGMLVGVTLREIKDGKARAGKDFRCRLASSFCLNPDGEFVVVGGSTFSLASPDGTVSQYTR